MTYQLVGAVAHSNAKTCSSHDSVEITVATVLYKKLKPEDILQLALGLVRGVQRSGTIKRFHGLSLNTLDEFLARRDVMDQANNLAGCPHLHAVSVKSYCTPGGLHTP